MIKLEAEIKKGCFSIVIKEPDGEIFLWGKNIMGQGVIFKLDGNNDLDDMIEIAEETKIERKILKEKYDKAVKAIS